MTSAISLILGWIMKSKATKIGAGLSAGALSGGGLLGLVFHLHSGVVDKIEKQRADQKEYVQLMIRPIEAEIRGVKDYQKRTLEELRELRKVLINK